MGCIVIALAVPHLRGEISAAEVPRRNAGGERSCRLVCQYRMGKTGWRCGHHVDGQGSTSDTIRTHVAKRASLHLISLLRTDVKSCECILAVF